MTKIAIVGGGFSGTLLALHLLRRCPNTLEVVLLERSTQFGRGAAYSTGNPNHLLNVPAGKMSAFHDRPRDFLEWLQQSVDSDVKHPVAEHSFVPRRVFGAYVRNLLNQEMKASFGNDRLTLMRGDVGRIETSSDQLVIHRGRGRSVRADMAVLAVGNFPPEPPAIDDPSFYDTNAYRPDPWAADAFTDLAADSPVMLIGTGLTMVDAVISLLDRGHRGPIHAVSRRGLLPQRHMPAAKSPTPRCQPFPTSLVELTRFLRQETQRAEAEGSNWRAVVDELRPFTLDVWGELPAHDKARFLRHLRPWWEIHRHRTAGAVADRIEAAIIAGQLRTHAGKIRSLQLRDSQVDVQYRPRGTDRIEQLRVARAINCSGPSCDYGRISHPLINSLLEDGLIRPDALKLGLDVTPNCALKDRRGAISGKLFAVGPVTKGAFWEMTAVPDIRRQCEYLANYLSGFVKVPPVDRARNRSEHEVRDEVRALMG